MLDYIFCYVFYYLHFLFSVLFDYISVMFDYIICIFYFLFINLIHSIWIWYIISLNVTDFCYIKCLIVTLHPIHCTVSCSNLFQLLSLFPLHPDVDECLGNPCQNGGMCTHGVNSYACKCQSGYVGTNCEYG